MNLSYTVYRYNGFPNKYVYLLIPYTYTYLYRQPFDSMSRRKKNRRRPQSARENEREAAKKNSKRLTEAEECPVWGRRIGTMLVTSEWRPDLGNDT